MSNLQRIQYTHSRYRKAFRIAENPKHFEENHLLPRTTPTYYLGCQHTDFTSIQMDRTFAVS